MAANAPFSEHRRSTSGINCLWDQFTAGIIGSAEHCQEGQEQACLSPCTASVKPEGHSTPSTTCQWPLPPLQAHPSLIN